MAKIHAFSKTLPPDEKYDLYTQIRRCSKGVTGNIAEAYGRYHYLDSLHYYSIARGELNETLARLIDAHVLKVYQSTRFRITLQTHSSNRTSPQWVYVLCASAACWRSGVWR